jgi:hypothetical protein
VAIDKIGLCNMALGQVPAPAITSFEEKSVEAEWSARLYSPTLAYMLDRHDWKFPIARIVLAVVDNDRSGEWSFAYAIPEECVTELRIIPPYDDSGVSIPLLAGQALSPWFVTALSVPAIYRYLVAGSKLYSNIENATLEYITGDLNESVFRPLFIDAFVKQLASVLVMPVKQDRARQGDLIKMAELAIDRAICDEINRDDAQSTYGEFVNDTELARSGVSLPFGTAFWPIGR